MIEKPIHVEQLRQLAREEGSAVGTSHIFWRWRSLKLILVAAFVLIALLAISSALLQKGLWMKQLGYSGVFRTRLSVRCGMFCAAFVVALLYVWINLRLAARNGAVFGTGALTSQFAVAAKLGIQTSPTVVKLAMGAVAAAAALIFASSLPGNGIRISAFVMADPLGRPILSSESIPGFICSVSPFMNFCRAA